MLERFVLLNVQGLQLSAVDPLEELPRGSNVIGLTLEFIYLVHFRSRKDTPFVKKLYLELARR